MDRNELDEVVSKILNSRHPNSEEALPLQSTITQLIENVQEIFKNEKSLLRINGEITIVGDIHGNVDDLIRILQTCNYPPEQNFLFLGDYVDRGACSVEVLLLLFSLKVLYPQNIYILRGNHECEELTSIFGFKQECETKLSTEIYEMFINCFSYMPFAAVVNNSIFCVHGGITPELTTLEDIESLTRPMLISDSPISNGILWSDPRMDIEDFKPNDRGAGCFFNAANLKSFLDSNNLSKLIRSHEYCQFGYEYPFGEEGNCITIFSNSDYCGINNYASVAIVTQDCSIEFKEFKPKGEEEYNKTRIDSPTWLLTSDSPKNSMIHPQFDLTEDQLFGIIQSLDFTLDF
ncbi:Ser/Thr protein phosphatase [Histomonas meleagridis]|uniref:Ser/Thr protein phosphatase n=1 Tax=Histomonas meleagridis TaxID=135588 RepID=UPI003559E815|nr:Ser/Thr protein phosphatase [Histomonas meleagridis]KAH0796146.1 Ser/Thr protein phosphatase [Histomonas meleagridis]